MKKFAALFVSVFLLIFLLSDSIYSVAVNRKFYNKQYEKNKTHTVTGISPAELGHITDNLLLYLEGSRENLDMTAIVNGYSREVFDTKEKSHMVDVKALFSLLKSCSNYSFLMAVFFLLMGFVKMRIEFLPDLTTTYLRTCVLFLVLITGVGFLIFFQFDWFWTTFHEIVFTNDLWLLDPKVSIMINMFPLELFFACCTKILLRFSLALGLTMGAAYYIRKSEIGVH